jgi:hypothetical protein
MGHPAREKLFIGVGRYFWCGGSHVSVLIKQGLKPGFVWTFNAALKRRSSTFVQTSVIPPFNRLRGGFLANGEK